MQALNCFCCGYILLIQLLGFHIVQRFADILQIQFLQCFLVIGRYFAPFFQYVESHAHTHIHTYNHTNTHNHTRAHVFLSILAMAAMPATTSDTHTHVQRRRTYEGMSVSVYRRKNQTHSCMCLGEMLRKKQTFCHRQNTIGHFFDSF